jgi:hypothetical protein
MDSYEHKKYSESDTGAPAPDIKDQENNRLGFMVREERGKTSPLFYYF